MTTKTTATTTMTAKTTTTKTITSTKTMTLKHMLVKHNPTFMQKIQLDV